MKDGIRKLSLNPAVIDGRYLRLLLVLLTLSLFVLGAGAPGTTSGFGG
jgi:hypothetical protein